MELQSEWAKHLLHLLALLLMQVKTLEGDRGFPAGYCQVYSYNINQRESRVQEKHFFVCCNNIDEKVCPGFTYQKPSRTESFCSGQVIQREGSHWTQMESNSFPDKGRFYCGGCCGQHLAMDTCNKRLQDRWQAGCTNWVQCFQKQCRSVVAAVLANQPLKCSLPPAPHPKHFRQESRTLPANVSLKMNTPPTDPAHHLQALIDNATCSEEWCQSTDMTTRCRKTCCEKFCCLPDGPQDYLSSTLIWGLTTMQVIGIAIGSVALLAAFVGIMLLVLKRYGPGCGSVKVPTTDTQILVIEGPEDLDSDPEDSA